MDYKSLFIIYLNYSYQIFYTIIYMMILVRQDYQVEFTKLSHDDGNASHLKVSFF